MNTCTIDIIEEGNNNYPLINDLMVFPNDVIVEWDNYNPIIHGHLGNSCHVVTPKDDEYLAILSMYSKQKTKE